MIRHPRHCSDPLSPEQCDAIHAAALGILEETGIAILCHESVALLDGAGARVDADRVFLPAPMVERAVAQAPRTFTLHARNPLRSVVVGGETMLVSPGYGSPSIADRNGKRRAAALADFDAFARMAGASPCIDVTGGVLVEPLDVPPALRPLEMTRSLLAGSDKPFMGSVDGAEGAEESLAIARLLFPDIPERTVMLGLVNVNSPLRLDARMAAALLTYARAGQGIILTPGILMGVTAPVTAAGAMAQALAELLAGVTLAQAARAGTPVIIGTGGFGADLRTGGPGFGRPENALGTLLGAQVARKIGLPFRCSGGVTGSRRPDIRSGYERMMTAMAAWCGGAHLCMQAAGTLDNINSMSYEQFAVDVEIWSYLRRLGSRPDVDSQTLAREVIASLPPDYLGCDHTLAHMTHEMAAVTLATARPYEEWIAGGGPDAVALTAERTGVEDPAAAPLPLTDAQSAALECYARERRAALMGTADSKRL